MKENRQKTDDFYLKVYHAYFKTKLKFISKLGLKSITEANRCLISKWSEIFFFITMVLSEAALKKLSKDEVINLALDHQGKFDSI